MRSSPSASRSTSSRERIHVDRTHDHFPCTAHQGTHQSMLADSAIRSLPGRLGPEERRPEYFVGLGRGDCDAAHEILKTNIYHKYKWNILNIYQSYDIIESIYQVYT